jgi:hypothetical protein
MINFRVMSRADIESDFYLTVKESSMPHIILSTTSETIRKGSVVVKENPHCKGIIRFTFDDLDTRHLEIVKQKQGLCKYQYKLFTVDNAKEILTFVNEHINEIEAIITHCDAGISRSAAMAASLSKIITNMDDFFFKNYIPNMLVYTTILNEYYYNELKYKNIHDYYYAHLPEYEGKD